jgi:GT2 family glycosyltransferase
MTEPDAIAWPLVLAVVVTHNGRRWLPGCLKSLALQTYPALEVVIVDNGSDDAELVPHLAERLLPEASLLRIEQNLGFGAAANRALEVAPEARDAEYYLFLHDDTALDRDCVGLLVSSALETDAGVVGGKGLSWDEPEVLLEVGMSADEFGYPVSGLEEGEIDQGQHDTRREVLFVTSACILVSRATVERCGSWDGGYFLFGEDLDLCIRARLCGFPVVVAPKAVFHHAVAMATGRREGMPRESIRYYTRRNRLRTIAKNTSAARVLLLIALYTGVLAAEMILLTALRRFGETPTYLRAYGGFVRSLPDVVRRRRAVQRRRKVPDRRIRRYTVRDLPRVRIFLERRLLQWGAETIRLSARTFSFFTPSALSERLARWSRSPAVFGSAAIFLVLLIAGRHVLLSGGVGAGSLWPFPAELHRLLSDYFAGWRDIGLGTTGAPAPALPLLWFVQFASFGNPGLAQKLLVVALLGAGLFGVARLMKRRSRFLPARLAAVGIYALAPVVRLSMATGDLGALALYATAPFLIEMGLRMVGPAPASARERPPVAPTADSLSRQAIRLGLVSALTIALAPSAAVAILVLWGVVGVHALLHATGSSEYPARRLGWLLASLPAAVLILVPWSFEGLRPGGVILGPLGAGVGGGVALRPLWSRVGFADGLLLNPGVGALAGLVTIGAVLGALLVTSSSRRREVRLLAAVVVVFGLWAGLVGKGFLPAPVVSPALWLMVPLVCLALSSGYLLAGLAEDLSKHAMGWRQILGAVAAGVFGVAFIAGWVPTVLSWHGPPASALTGTGSEAAALAAVRASARSGDDFRVLWLGSRLVDPIRAGLGPRQAAAPYLVTGPNGVSMLDVSPPAPGPAGSWLTGAVSAILSGRTHLAGHLLAPAGIRYLIVDRFDPTTTGAVLRQQDFALGQVLPQVDIYQNTEALPIASVAPKALEDAAATADPAPLLTAQWPAQSGHAGFRRLSQGAFAGVIPVTGAQSVLIGEAYSTAWRASMAGQPLPHARSFGWANRFVIPAGATGPVLVDYSGEWIRVLWVALEAGLVLFALAMATVVRVPRLVSAAPPQRLAPTRRRIREPVGASTGRGSPRRRVLESRPPRRAGRRPTPDADRWSPPSGPQDRQSR